MSKNVALLVGINYAGSANELKGCINDVKNVKNMLLQKGYESENIVVLTDDQTDTTRMPTRDNILRFLALGISKMTKGDNFFFHYSGHGSQSVDQDGDEKDGDGLDETIIPMDFQKNGQITDDTLRDLVYRVPPESRFIGIVDACHSASSFDLRYLYDPVSKFQAKVLNVPQVKRGHKVILRDQLLMKDKKMEETKGQVFILSGCEDNQTSSDAKIGNEFSGALTKALLETLKSFPGCSIKMLPTKVREYIMTNKLGAQIPRLSFGRADFAMEKEFFA